MTGLTLNTSFQRTLTRSGLLTASRLRPRATPRQVAVASRSSRPTTASERPMGWHPSGSPIQPSAARHRWRRVPAA